MIKQGLRMAAARLASLHSSDRAWLLKQLPAEQARQLRELLRAPELKRWQACRLGEIELAEPEASPVAESSAPTAAPAPAPLPSELKELDAEWLALWLAARSTSEQKPVLDGLAGARARQVNEQLARSRSPLPPGLRDALRSWPARPSTFAEFL
jgi:hypothetical protein